MEEERTNHNSLKNAVLKLKEQRDTFDAENRKLRQELSAAQKEIAELNALIIKLEADYKRLKLAKAYGWNEESKKEADRRIAKLVRDINSCLVLLGE